MNVKDILNVGGPERNKRLKHLLIELTKIAPGKFEPRREAFYASDKQHTLHVVPDLSRVEVNTYYGLAVGDEQWDKDVQKVLKIFDPNYFVDDHRVVGPSRQRTRYILKLD